MVVEWQADSTAVKAQVITRSCERSGAAAFDDADRG
jgi:hypothetical protein